MHATERHTVTLATMIAALTLGLAACSDSTPASQGATPALSVATADSLGESVTNDAGEFIESSSYDGSTGVTLSAPQAGISINTLTPPPCTPTESPANPPNSDSDLVPDSVRFDYTGCTFTRLLFTHSISGFIDIIDPTPQNTDLAMRLVFTNFTKSRQNLLSGRTVSAQYNGTRQIAFTPDTVGHTIVNFQTVYTYADGRSATHVKDWTAKFTATTPGTILEGSPLPDGDWVINGTSTWTKGNGGTLDITVSTPVVLHHDPTCQLEPRFTSGTLQAVVTRNTNTSTVTIQFTACGQFTVTRS